MQNTSAVVRDALSADQVYVGKVSVVLFVFIVAVEVFPLTSLQPLVSTAPWFTAWQAS